MLDFFKKCWNFICPFQNNDEIKDKDNNITYYPNEERDFFIYEDANYNIQISDI
jgi:hypothetical protein